MLFGIRFYTGSFSDLLYYEKPISPSPQLVSRFSQFAQPPRLVSAGVLDREESRFGDKIKDSTRQRRNGSNQIPCRMNNAHKVAELHLIE